MISLMHVYARARANLRGVRRSIGAHVQEWPAGSLEETVQNAIKTWEMELSHKAKLEDFKSVSPGRFRLSVNGGRPLTGEETLAVGSYNALLTSPILPGAGAYDAAAETFESSHDLFRAAFPRGFAWEVIRVYSGPPVITFKFRHWGHMDGPYKGHAPTGDKVEFYGVAVLKVHTHVHKSLLPLMIRSQRQLS
jgi:hypothetical protein